MPVLGLATQQWVDAWQVPQSQHLGAQMPEMGMLQKQGGNDCWDQSGQLDEQHFIVIFVQH
jgi:hypothetical protein